MLHTFETTSKYTARREQRKKLMREMEKRSESDVLISVSDVDLEEQRSDRPSLASSPRSPSLLSFESARQLVSDEDAGSDDSSSLRQSSWPSSPSPKINEETLPEINLQEIVLCEEPVQQELYQPSHGAYFMRLYSCWASNFRCSKRSLITVAVTILLAIIVGCSVGLGQGKSGEGSQETSQSPPGTPSLPHIPPIHPEHQNNHSPNSPLQVHGILSSILVHFGVLDVRKFEDRATAQRQAVDFVAGTSVARRLQRSHASVQDWTSDPVLREVMELYALSVLWHSTQGMSWTEQSNWEAVDAEPCEYSGISCESKPLHNSGPALNATLKSGLVESGQIQVVSNITLDSNGLDGTLPSELSLLRDLEVLSLSNNALRGDLPEGLGHLGSLKVLRLGQNQFQGQVPGHWMGLRHLRELDLHENELRGTLPEGWSSLTFLSLFHNFFTGTIPSSLGETMPNLEVLLLDVNRISGRIPSQTGGLTNLRVFSARDNRLQGSVPIALGSCTSLETLELSENDLTGDVLGVVTQFHQLTALHLDKNSFQTTIPDSIAVLTNLKIFSLEHNQAGGEIPSGIRSLNKLETLKLGQNQLQGRIPSEIDELANLQFFDAAMNQLVGRLPVSLGDLAQLRELRLEDNRLTGEVPIELLELDHLVSLRLHHNELVGSVSPLCPLRDLSLQSFTADCQSQVTCSCCTECF